MLNNFCLLLFETGARLGITLSYDELRELDASGSDDNQTAHTLRQLVRATAIKGKQLPLVADVADGTLALDELLQLGGGSFSVGLTMMFQFKGSRPRLVSGADLMELFIKYPVDTLVVDPPYAATRSDHVGALERAKTEGELGEAVRALAKGITSASDLLWYLQTAKPQGLIALLRDEAIRSGLQFVDGTRVVPGVVPPGTVTLYDALGELLDSDGPYLNALADDLLPAGQKLSGNSWQELATSLTHGLTKRGATATRLQALILQLAIVSYGLHALAGRGQLQEPGYDAWVDRLKHTLVIDDRQQLRETVAARLTAGSARYLATLAPHKLGEMALVFGGLHFCRNVRITAEARGEGKTHQVAIEVAAADAGAFAASLKPGGQLAELGWGDVLNKA